MRDEFSEKQMKMVLEGKDIDFHYKHECEDHYKEYHWKELTEKEQLLVRKWVRFMFSKSKYINHGRSSYGLKHSCESDVGYYVHNDMMKKAFILEGFKAETGRINWYFNTKNKITKEKSEKFKELFKEEMDEIDKEYKIRRGIKEE